MAIAGALRKAGMAMERKLAVGQTSITGTGAVTSGLASVATGGAHVTVQNGQTTLAADGPAWVSSISGGTVNVVVLNVAAAANAISTTAKNLGWMAIGN